MHLLAVGIRAQHLILTSLFHISPEPGIRVRGVRQNRLMVPGTFLSLALASGASDTNTTDRLLRLPAGRFRGSELGPSPLLIGAIFS